jgi:hypothetical protein
MLVPMYNDDQSIKQFQLAHARDRLAEEARHVADNDDARLLGPHFSAEREGQRLMSVLALAAVALLAAGFYWVL